MADAVKDPKLAEVKAVLRRLQRMSPDGDGRAGDPGPDTTSLAKPGPALRPVETAALSKLDLAAPAPARSDPQFPLSFATLERETLPSTVALPPSLDVRGTEPDTRRPLMIAAGVVGVLAIVATAVVLRPQPEAPSAPTRSAVSALPPPSVPLPTANEPPRGLDTTPRVVDPSPRVAPPEIGPVHEPPPDGVLARSVDDARVDAAIAAAGAELAQGKVRAARDRLNRVATHPSPDVALLLGRSYDPTVLKEIADSDAEPDPTMAAKWYRTWHERAAAQGLVRDQRALDRLLRAMN